MGVSDCLFWEHHKVGVSAVNAKGCYSDGLLKHGLLITLHSTGIAPSAGPGVINDCGTSKCHFSSEGCRCLVVHRTVGAAPVGACGCHQWAGWWCFWWCGNLVRHAVWLVHVHHGFLVMLCIHWIGSCTSCMVELAHWCVQHWMVYTCVDSWAPRSNCGFAQAHGFVVLCKLNVLYDMHLLYMQHDGNGPGLCNT
jgi:hypothetical protein